MEHLHYSEQIPDHENPQDAVFLRENETITRLMQSQYLSPTDGVNILVEIGNESPQTQEYIRQFFQDLNILIEENILQYIPSVEPSDIPQEISDIPENPAITPKLQYSQKSVENVFENLQYIQESLHNSTNLTTAFIDRTISLFSDNTVFSAYQSQFEFAKSTGNNIFHSLQTIDVNDLSISQKEQYNSILQTLHFLSTLKLERTGFLQMLKNEIYAIPHTVDLMTYAVKGVVTGVYEGVKNIITSVADLAIFLGKYSFSSQYRQEIHQQAENIWNIIETHGLSHISDQIFCELDKEMKRISKLPDFEQSEAIGNLTGHILSFVGVAGGAVKVATRIEKLGTLSTLGHLGKAEKISLYTFDVLLNGIAETAIMKSIFASYRGVKAMLGNTELALAEKIRILDTEFANIQQFKSSVPEEIYMLRRYKEELTYQKNIFENLQQAKEVQIPYLERLRNIDDELHSLRSHPNSQIADRELRIHEIETEKIRVNIERQVVGLEKLGVPEEFSRDLLGSELLREKLPGGGDVLRRFETLLEIGVDYNRLIDHAVDTIPNFTKTDGMYIFGYTDNLFYAKLNGFMRGIPEVLENMTPEQITTATRFSERLEQAIAKMGNIEGEVVYRGDSYTGWTGKGLGDIVELRAFTSVANNTEDILLSEKNNIFVTIVGKEDRIKDITSLALVPNFGEKLKGMPHITTNEGIILPKSKVEIIHMSTGKRFDANSEKWIDTIEIKVQQID